MKWGGGGSGWFWKKKTSCKHLSKEKNCFRTNGIEKEFLHCRKKEKKLYQVISSSRELCKIPEKLQPFFPCSLLNSGFAELLLRISSALHVRSTYQEIWVSFSGSLWLRKSGFLFFSCFFSVAWKRICAQEVACFHSKKHKEHHHFGFIFNSEVLNLEVDWKKVEKIIRAIFHIIYKPRSTINCNSAFTPFLEILVHF